MQLWSDSAQLLVWEAEGGDAAESPGILLRSLQSAQTVLTGLGVELKDKR